MNAQCGAAAAMWAARGGENWTRSEGSPDREVR
jgi:hypothetical protein